MVYRVLLCGAFGHMLYSTLKLNKYLPFVVLSDTTLMLFVQYSKFSITDMHVHKSACSDKIVDNQV